MVSPDLRISSPLPRMCGSAQAGGAGAKNLPARAGSGGAGGSQSGDRAL